MKLSYRIIYSVSYDVTPSLIIFNSVTNVNAVEARISGTETILMSLISAPETFTW
jgi:hypothetical protein